MIGGCRPRIEDGYDAFPAGSPPWLGERAPEFGDTAVWALRSPFRCVTLRSKSISNRGSLVRGNGIRRIFNGRARARCASAEWKTTLLSLLVQCLRIIMIQRFLRTGLQDQARVRLREIDGVGEPLHCSLSDTMSSGTELWLLQH